MAFESAHIFCVYVEGYRSFSIVLNNGVALFYPYTRELSIVLGLKAMSLMFLWLVKGKLEKASCAWLRLLPIKLKI